MNLFEKFHIHFSFLNIFIEHMLFLDIEFENFSLNDIFQTANNVDTFSVIIVNSLTHFELFIFRNRGHSLEIYHNAT